MEATLRSSSRLYRVEQVFGISEHLNQITNDKNMAIRLLEYRAMLNRIHRLFVRQYVLYIGGGAMAMADSIHEPDLHFAYKLIDFSTA